MNRDNDAPCQHCEFRSASCHATCGVYKDWRALRDKHLTEAHEAKKKMNEYLNYKESLFSKILRQRAREAAKNGARRRTQ